MSNTKYTTKEFALINGRHEIINDLGKTVDKAIFQEVPDPMDFQAIRNGIANFLDREVEMTVEPGMAINQAYGVDGHDVMINMSHTHLIVYVTGLTMVTTELVRQCLMNGVPLTLAHYDKSTGKYKFQVIW